ncbi:hypothetical protein DRF60_05885 [Chryseobacterium elymi]|uniref:Uncharacterized protein n=1 Tax=Chryseobacterium elymi TaxID=395936 RepID=A0A3D9DMU3_9FLAO|nr:hypothetical protein [Chryseobacterium elymi]REC79355.1 hypothetical protein DRF60_05885 [Chryseobacterium elymi]
MKKLMVIGTAGISSLMLSQVGINTQSPTETLDVNGNIRFRSVPQYSSLLSADLIMVLDANGVGKRLPVSALIPPGKYVLDDIYSIVAVNPIKRNIHGVWNGSQQINNIDLEMTQSIVIPANKDVQVVVNYSIPLGMEIGGAGSECANDALSYYGIRFLKNGNEMQAGSRKFSFPKGSNGVKMSTVSAAYVEQIKNTTSTDMTVTYTLNGYLELKSGTVTGTDSSPCTVKYNMHAATGENYNWGKGTMTVQLYKKDL